MGVPVSDVKAAETVSAESLLESFKSIDAAERRRHASVLNYWLSIRGDKDVAPIRDLDPLEISDAGPNSLLLELIGGGEDAEIKHRGDALLEHANKDRLSQSPRPSLLACIAGKLAIVAISRNFLAFEDKFATDAGETRCWITLLPFSSTGVWVDYVYAFVSVEGECAVSEEAVAAEPVAEAVAEDAAEQPVKAEEVAAVEEAVADVEEIDIPPIVVEEEVAAIEDEAEALVAEPIALDPPMEAVDEPADAEAVDHAPGPEAVGEKRPGFSKIFEALTGFHGTNVKVEPTLPPIVEESPAEAELPPETVPEIPEVEPEPEPEILELDVAEEIVAEPSPELEVETAEAVADAPAEPVSHSAEGTLQSKLEEVRAKADEARLAKLRSNIALYEGLGAAYDFALDAEHSPEEYLRLVEEKGLKIQLRSPMTPVVKLAFDGLCDDSMIGQLEAVLAWALKQDLPRGTLAGKIETAGGIGPLLNGQAEAA
jgi:hypothetical protein